MCGKSLFLIIFFTLMPMTALANERFVTAAYSCDAAAKNAASKWGVPEQVMLAITRVETGRIQNSKILPWPWTINLAGKGYWFEDAEQALAFATETQANGNSNFDVGCFQINLSWHGGAFASLEDAFSPERNADYAAEFLTQLYRQTGSWRSAAAAYHSKTPEYAEAYVAKLEPVLREILAVSSPEPEAAKYLPEKSNRFPFLQAGTMSGKGSLVPLIQLNDPLIGGSR